MKTKLYECEICSSLHPWDWNGDCREDANRYGDEREYAERTGLTPAEEFNIVVYSMSDRVEADEVGL